jgi:hypothetical protein
MEVINHRIPACQIHLVSGRKKDSIVPDLSQDLTVVGAVEDQDSLIGLNPGRGLSQEELA